ncbi:MAG: diguanylate cyclase [Campylobacterales bacterium]|nr:diguanylate cyclase [Campylobacterales bacterium]
MVKSILCVDDVENNLFILTNLLGQKSDYLVHTAQSGQRAFEILLKEQVDLILLDIMMPEMDGFEVAQLIHSNPMTRNLPIIFVTAKTDEESIKEAYERGGVDYIVKPYRSYELLERVKLHLALQEAHNAIYNKQKVLESILNQQDNMIIISDGRRVFWANQAFLKFFQLIDAKELSTKIPDITQLFQSSKNYDIEAIRSDNDWLQLIEQHSKTKDFIVCMINPLNQEHYSFMLKLTSMDERKQYIITFTDVSNLVSESKKLENKVFRDSLTGLYNREKLNEFLAYEIEMAKRYGESVSIILFDIDNFKKVNDTFGHLEGDRVLQTIAREIKHKIRKTDLFARWGGEEFVIVTPSTAINSAINLAQSLRKIIANIDFGAVGSITSSFGVTTYQPQDSLDDLLHRVDQAMYAAKSNGKNRVMAE